MRWYEETSILLKSGCIKFSDRTKNRTDFSIGPCSDFRFGRMSRFHTRVSTVIFDEGGPVTSHTSSSTSSTTFLRPTVPPRESFLSRYLAFVSHDHHRLFTHRGVALKYRDRVSHIQIGPFCSPGGGMAPATHYLLSFVQGNFSEVHPREGIRARVFLTKLAKHEVSPAYPELIYPSWANHPENSSYVIHPQVQVSLQQ